MTRSHLTMLALAVFLFCQSALVAAQEPAVVAPETKAPKTLPSLAPVIWEGTPLSIQALRGKTVVLLVYATWCPKCNGWSGPLFTQIKEAIEGKPVFVIAINVDDRLDPSLSYVKQRGFVAPNILHGYDPSMTKRLGLKSELFSYVMVAPDGTRQGSGSAGMFIPQGKNKQFVLPIQLAKAPGEFTIFHPDMPESLQRLFWPMEMSQILPETMLLKARTKLDKSEQPLFDTAFNGFLDTQLDKIRTLYKGELVDRLSAYELADLLATTYPKSKQGKTARRGIDKIGKDLDFKRELAAKKFYDKTMSLAAADPKRLRQGLRSMAGRFRGTHYGTLATEAMAALEQ